MYIVIGKQQWGIRITDHQWTTTYPIAFSTICYAINVTCEINSSDANAANVYNITKTNCQIVISYGKGYWIAIGI